MEIPLKKDGKPDINKLMQIKSCESLKYLNHNWNDWSITPKFSSHRKVIGPVVSTLKKLINKVFKNNLNGYFKKELAFQENLVRHLNNSSKYVDDSQSKIFWSLIDKVDTDIKMVNQRNDELFSNLIDEMDNLKQRIVELEAKSGKNK